MRAKTTTPATNENSITKPEPSRDASRSVPVEVRFARAQLKLNDRRKKLIRAIIDDAGETSFLSSVALAKRFDVDAGTLIRTIQVLGYERFADFSADLRQVFLKQVTPYSAMRAATKQRRSLADRISQCVERDAENLHALRTELDATRLEMLARRIHRSPHILVVGGDLAATLAGFLAYGLTTLGFKAEAPVGSTGNIHHKVNALTKNDLLIAISFRRGLRDTVEAVQRASAIGAATFGITDGDNTPIARYCDAHLVASIAKESFIDSYVAPLAAINAVLLACAHVNPKRSLEKLRQAEEEFTSGSRWYREPQPRGNAPRGGDNADGTRRPARSRRTNGADDRND